MKPCKCGHEFEQHTNHSSHELTWLICKECDCVDYRPTTKKSIQGGEKMKTLNDIELIAHQHYLKHKRKNTPLEDWDNAQTVLSEQLKQAAIEWIKELESPTTVVTNGLPITDSKSKTYILHGETILWIKHFFNITEKDLKE